jgi:hypothetical protein
MKFTKIIKPAQNYLLNIRVITEPAMDKTCFKCRSQFIFITLTQ